MGSRSVPHGRWVFVLLALLATAGAVPAADKVRVSVVAILATERNDKVDPRLKCIADEVRKKHPRLRGFTLAAMSCDSLAVGQKERFDLVAGQTAAVTVQKAASPDNRVQLKVAPPLMGEITYDTTCGKFLPIVTPFRTRDRDLLILAVRVQPCHRK